MAKLDVLEVNKLPEFATGHLFNSPLFQQLKTGEKTYFLLTRDGKISARMCFAIESTEAISGQGATFGSIDYDEILEEEEISLFIHAFNTRLEQKGIKKIIIKHWPAAYNMSAVIAKAFKKNGYKALTDDVNQHIIIKDEEFSQGIKYNEQKKLKKAINSNYKFILLDHHKLTEVYQLIKETRDRKGYPTSMSLEQLQTSINALPEHYLLFGVNDGNKLIAAAVSVRISRDIMYNFYHGDDVNYRSTSPVVMLVAGIYQYCQQKNISILDLGISSIQGQLNQGLFDFKQNIGCESSSKSTYVLNI